MDTYANWLRKKGLKILMKSRLDILHVGVQKLLHHIALCLFFLKIYSLFAFYCVASAAFFLTYKVRRLDIATGLFSLLTGAKERTYQHSMPKTKC